MTIVYYLTLRELIKLNNDKKILLCKDVYKSIEATIGAFLPEKGGIIGSSLGGEVIDNFFFDKNGQSFSDKYIPCVDEINFILKTQWTPRKIMLTGFVHSHVQDRPFPSCGDISYAAKVLKALPHINSFLMPIVTAEPFNINFYSVSVNQRLSVDRIDYSLA